MPKGKHLANEMDSEVVFGLYHAVKAAGNIDYDALAVVYGSKDKRAAQTRLNAILKAQEKGTNPATSTAVASAVAAAANAPAAPAKTPTKRKAVATAKITAKKVKAESNETGANIKAEEDNDDEAGMEDAIAATEPTQGQAN